MAIKKSNVINEFDVGASQEELTEKYNINRSLVVSKEREKIKVAAVSEYRSHFKIRPSVKYRQLHETLLDVFKKARAKGHHVNFGWLWSKARQTYHKETGDPDSIIRKHVFVNFLKKFNIRMRAKQRNKKKSKESYRDSLMKWHATTRERLIRCGRNESYDEKWGRFTPEQRFNVDQSPLPFAFNSK